MSYPGTNCAFAGNTLSTFDGNHGIIVKEIHHAGKTNKQAQSYAFAHANASSIPFAEYPSKPILIVGKIVGTSVADCDNQIDIFNSLLTTQNGNLDFDYRGGSLNRRYIATATNIDVQRPDGLYDADFNVLFTATRAFGQDTSLSSLVANLLSNGDFESGTTGWSSYHSATIAQSVVQAFSGTHSLSVATTGSGVSGAQSSVVTGLTPSTPYTFSAYVFAPVGVVVQLEVDTYTSGGVFVAAYASNQITGNGAWQRVTQTVNFGSTEAQAQMFLYSSSATTFYVDAVQFEAGTSANTFNNCIGLTGNNLQFNFTLLGTAPYQAPIITVTYSAIGSAPVSGTVIIGNDATGQAIAVNRTWAATDVLVIDTTLTTNTPVTVNGAAVEFSGALPLFFTPNVGGGGSGTLDYSDTFTSRTLAISANYYKYWL